jgi:hypothetical protein
MQTGDTAVFEVDYLFNAALMIRTEAACILVDALAADDNFFDRMDGALEEDLLSGHRVCDALVFTHTHFDHYDKKKILRFMRSQPECLIVLPEEHDFTEEEMTGLRDRAMLRIMREGRQEEDRIAVGSLLLSYQKIKHLNYDDSRQFCVSVTSGGKTLLICADAASSDPVELAGAIARDRARLDAPGAVGLRFPRKLYYEKELSFVNSRSYGPGRYDLDYEEKGRDYPIGYVRWTEGRNLEAFVDLLASGHLDVRPLISHRFPIEQAPEAYELITGKKQEPFLGVLLTYPEASAGRLLKGETTRSLPVRGAPEKRPPAELQPVALGVLGAGNFATAVLLPAVRKTSGVQLVGIISASGSSAQHAAGRFGFRYAASDEKRILEDTQINTVAILTRHHLHARQAAAALAAFRFAVAVSTWACAEMTEVSTRWRFTWAAFTVAWAVLTFASAPFAWATAFSTEAEERLTSARAPSILLSAWATSPLACSICASPIC